jgi:hypothetical protein
VDAFRPAVSLFGFERPPSKFQPSLIEEVAQLVYARHPDQHRSGIRHESEAFFALTFRVFGLFALRNVA